MRPRWRSDLETCTAETIKNSPYSEYLEGFVREVFENEPTAIAAVMITKDGYVLSNYYECGWLDKLSIAGTIQTDAILTAVKMNGEEIMDAWDVDESDEEEEEEIEDG